MSKNSWKPFSEGNIAGEPKQDCATYFLIFHPSSLGELHFGRLGPLHDRDRCHARPSGFRRRCGKVRFSIYGTSSAGAHYVIEREVQSGLEDARWL